MLYPPSLLPQDRRLHKVEAVCVQILSLDREFKAGVTGKRSAQAEAQALLGFRCTSPFLCPFTTPLLTILARVVCTWCDSKAPRPHKHNSRWQFPCSSDPTLGARNDPALCRRELCILTKHGTQKIPLLYEPFQVFEVVG